MTTNIFTLNVDLKKEFTSVVPTFRQGDTARLQFKIYDEGKLIPTNTFNRAEVYSELKNGEVIKGDCVIGSEYITYDYNGLEMQFKDSFVDTTLTLINGNTQVSIRPFKVYIYKEFKPQNLTYVGILQELIKQNQDLSIELNTLIMDFESFDYSATQNYKFPNLVLYNGSTYIALKDVTGITPNDDKVNWRLVSLKGTVNAVNSVLPDNSGNVILKPIHIGASTKEEVSRNTYESGKAKSIVQKASKNSGFCVALIGDDAPENDIIKLFPIVYELNVPLGIAVIPGLVGTNAPGFGQLMTWEQIEEAANNGVEILAHTNLHRDSATLTEAELDADLRLCKETLNAHGYPAEGLVFPYNSTNYEVEKIARKYFDYCFAKSGALGQFEGRNFPKIDNNRIARVALGSFYDTPNSEYVNQDTSSYEYYIERIEEARLNDSGLCFVLHTHTNNFPIEQQQIMRNVIQYCRDTNVPLVKPSELFAIQGNIVQIGSYIEANKFIIDKTGKITANDSELYEKGELNSANGNTGIGSFTTNKISYNRVTAAYATIANGFPVQYDGTLITYKLDTFYANIYQEYIPFNPNLISYERRLMQGSVWGSWSPKELPVNFDVLNGRNGTDLISTYPVGITKTQFNSNGANTQNMPFGRGGLLTTEKYSNDYWASKQTYETSAVLDTVSNKSNVYERGLNASNQWTAWERIGNFLLANPSYSPSTTVTAHSTSDITLSITSVKASDDINVVPTTDLPGGLMYQVQKINNGSVVLRIANITNADITFSSQIFNVFVSR